MINPKIDENLPVACQLGAVPPQERARWLEVAREVYASVEELLELPDGLALRLNGDRLVQVGEYVMRDRRCCAFVRWEIVVEPANGPAWLKMRGPNGTKEFMIAALEHTDLLPLEVARRAGLALERRKAVTLDGAAALADGPRLE